jgi:acyl-CoA thioesterase-1
VGVLTTVFTSRRWLQRVARAVAVLGFGVTLCSAVPLPVNVYVVWTIIVCTWLVAGMVGRHARLCAVGVVLSVLLANGREYSSRQPRGHSFTANAQLLYVVGDSLSAGIQDGETPWPELLARQHGITVTNAARPGATVASALPQTAGIRSTSNRVLVVALIGGNDLLHGTPQAEFERNLAQVAGNITGKSRDHAAFLVELPLPPFADRYGLAQRRLLRDCHLRLRLIPRRELAGILCSPGNTTDGIHLSPQGHQAMADVVWRYIAPYMATNATTAATAP